MSIHSSRQILIFTIIFILLAIGIGCFGISEGFAQPNNDKPFSGTAIDPEGATPFQLTSTIMEINFKPTEYVVVGEKTIMVMMYKLESEVKKTQLLNPYGSTITLDELKKGERVIVQGLKLKDGTLVGTRIQVKPKKR